MSNDPAPDPAFVPTPEPAPPTSSASRASRTSSASRASRASSASDRPADGVDRSGDEDRGSGDEDHNFSDENRGFYDFSGSEVSPIPWSTLLPFSPIFRGFRIAAHPSKLLLALAMVALLYAAGRGMDAVWPRAQAVYPGEIEAFGPSVGRGVGSALTRTNDPDAFVGRFADAGITRELLRERSEAVASTARATVPPRPDGRPATLRDVRSRLISLRDATAAEARADFARRVEALRAETAPPTNIDRTDPSQVTRLTAARDLRDARVAAAYADASAAWSAVRSARGRGIFAAWLDYQASQLNAAAWSVPRLDVTGPQGLLASLGRFLVAGPGWMITQRPLYALLFGLILLATTAILGGAITRIAAVQVARDERVPIRSALKFSTQKFLSFLTAPLLPVLVFFGIGLALSVAGLLLYVPYAGPIVVGAGFIVAILAGVLMTLVLLGTAGGVSLMYPTIAAEGTDSFDAISRGFSYVYARPWRLAFYALVALVYAALTYLFVKFFLWLALRLALGFTDLLVVRRGADGVPILDTMVPGPTPAVPGATGGLTGTPTLDPPAIYDPLRLSYDIDFLSLNTGQAVGAVLAAFWAYLAISLLGAFAISLYFTLSTIVYYLLRREVDATDPDEVYLDPNDDPYGQANDDPPPPAASASPTAGTPPKPAPTQEAGGATVGVYPAPPA